VLAADRTTLLYYPTGPIYDYRWKVLETVLEHTAATDGPVRLIPFSEAVTQDRGMALLASGGIDVVALGTSGEREAKLLPVKFDILRGMVGFRLFLIRSSDQARIAAMDDDAFQKKLVFGLNRQWADLPVMLANGFTVETSSGYDNLFSMLAAGHFDAFPRGLNEAKQELEKRKDQYSQLSIENTRALFFNFPIYFWVNKSNTALATRIERGLQLAMADGSLRNLFESYHADEIAMVQKVGWRVIRLENPVLPAGTPAADTSWWWRQGLPSR
jgi:hypothetical protein